jgi:hypothetical protein
MTQTPFTPDAADRLSRGESALAGLERAPAAAT